MKERISKKACFFGIEQLQTDKSRCVVLLQLYCCFTTESITAYLDGVQFFVLFQSYFFRSCIVKNPATDIPHGKKRAHTAVI